MYRFSDIESYEPTDDRRSESGSTRRRETHIVSSALQYDNESYCNTHVPNDPSSHTYPHRRFVGRLTTHAIHCVHEYHRPHALEYHRTFGGTVDGVSGMVVAALLDVTRTSLVHCTQPFQRQVPHGFACLVGTSKIQPLQIRRGAHNDNHTTQHAIP